MPESTNKEKANNENAEDSSQMNRDDFDSPVHNWRQESYEQKNFFDDGTMTFFWRAHTLTALFFLICFLVYEALFSTPAYYDSDNIKRGVVAMVSSFILLGISVIPDGPFKRPHPALWRFTFICSIVYELFLIFFLYQNSWTTRQLLKHLDENLGEPLEEKDYGGNCYIYDSSVPDNPFHNVWDKLDLFVPLHLFGWWLKTLLLRDWWLCCVISVMFEILEYSLEHQLPNFSECWWDHWILDALVCNGLGIYFGMKTLNYFTMKTYSWRGLWNIPTYRGKFRRIVGQFGPYVWVSYDWKPLSSLGRWCTTLGIIAVFLVAELNTFYLKFVLWVPPGHWVNLIRLVLILPWGAVAIREVFQYLDDPDCHVFGRQSWIFLAIIATEFLIILKFGAETVSIPFPQHVMYLWLGIFICVVLWTIWHFLIHPHTIKIDPDESTKKKEHWLQLKNIETKFSFTDSKFFNFIHETFQFKKTTAQQTTEDQNEINDKKDN